MDHVAERLLKREEELEKHFEKLSTWEDRYKEIIAMGRSMAPYPENERTETHEVKGCQSKVWLKAHLSDGKIQFVADSDALIVKGLLAVLLKIYSGSTPDEILSFPPQFIKKFGFETHLTPTRTGGLFAIHKQIVYYATAFKVLLTSQ